MTPVIGQEVEQTLALDLSPTAHLVQHHRWKQKQLKSFLRSVP